jgi:hypothetical protein
MAFLLNHYLLDIVTNYPTNDANGIVVVTADAHDDRARFGQPNSALVGATPPAPVKWHDPFNGGYYVKSLRILGIGGSGKDSRAGRRYESDSVLLTTEATVLFQGQKSLVALGASGGPLELIVGKELKKVVKETGQGWPELVEEMENANEYQQRSNSNFNTGSQWTEQIIRGGSGRRTEIATGVYLVKRKAK